MDVFVGIDKILRPLKNAVLTIGNFDGVHRGHQTLFQRVMDTARELDGEAVVMTFHPHPLQVLFAGNGPVFITPHERKLQLIEACGIDVTIVVPFTKEFAEISADDFVEKILVETIGVKGVVVGYDYKFGRDRVGNTDYLKEKGKQFGFSVDVVGGIETDGTIVSSTAIRQLIHAGNLREANKLLGRSYEIAGPVVGGRSRGGRLLGFPTANLRPAQQACPKPGVYAVEVEVEGQWYGGAANLGYNPTFGDTELTLEVHILDFDRDIYGKPMTVRFIDRLRSEKRFSNLEDLTAQIKKDVEKTRKILAAKDIAPGDEQACSA